jgi:T5SS/PEP-CTERM-associated repeat protein
VSHSKTALVKVEHEKILISNYEYQEKEGLEGPLLHYPANQHTLSSLRTDRLREMNFEAVLEIYAGEENDYYLEDRVGVFFASNISEVRYPGKGDTIPDNLSGPPIVYEYGSDTSDVEGSIVNEVGGLEMATWPTYEWIFVEPSGIDPNNLIILSNDPNLVDADNDGYFDDEDGDGEIALNGSLTLGHANGDEPLVRVENAAAVLDNNVLQVSDGTVYAGRAEEALFSGPFTLNTETLTASLGRRESALRLASSVDITLDRFRLAPESVRAEGSLTLPADFGGREIDVPLTSEAPLVIDQDGLSLGLQGTVPFPDVAFTFANLVDFPASDLSVSYDYFEDAVKLQGEVKAETFTRTSAESLTLNLVDENYLRIKDGKVDAVGSLTLEDLTLPGRWRLDELTLELDTISGTVGGFASVTFPFGRTVKGEAGAGFGAEFVVKPLELNAIKAEFAPPKPVPIGKTSFFIQEFRGSIGNLAPSVSDPIFFGDGITVSVGPLMDASPLFGDLDGRIDTDSITGQIDATLINTNIGKIEGETTLDWDGGKFDVSGSTDLFSGALTGGLDLTANGNFDFTVNGSATATFPSVPSWFFAGDGFSGNYTGQFTNDGDYSNDYVEVRGSIAGVERGFRGYFDGDFEFVGLKSIPFTSSFAVSEGKDSALLGISWENATNQEVEVRVIDPDGQVINANEFAAQGLTLVDELSTPTRRGVLIDEPAAGIWDIDLVDASGLGEVQTYGFETSDTPTLAILETVKAQSGDHVEISYQAQDNDSLADVALFYDDDDSGNDGVPFATGLDETNGVSSSTWDLQDVAPGTYYVYGRISDGVNAPVFAYSESPVTVDADAATSTTKPQARVFLAEGGDFTLSDPADVFGRSSVGESALISENARNVALDGNIDRIDLPVPQSETTFQVVNGQLQIRTSGQVLVSFTGGLNQPVEVRFADGDTTLSQTGASSFALADANGSSVTIDSTATTPGVGLGANISATAGGAAPQGPGGPAANVFLQDNASFTMSDPAQVFGRGGGSETVRLTEAALNVQVDGNVEQIELTPDLSASTFQVVDGQLQISVNGSPVATFTGGLNQAVGLQFANGEGILQQTGAATFELTGPSGQAAIGDAPTTPDIGLGDGGAPPTSDVVVTGDVRVDDSGPVTSLPDQASTLDVGASATGTVSVSDGAGLTFTSDGFDNVEIGSNETGDGRLTLSGQGTSLTTVGTDNTIQVGRVGQGVLEIENGATVNTLDLELGREASGSGEVIARGDGTRIIATSQNGRFSDPFAFESGFVQVGRSGDGTFQLLEGAQAVLRAGETQNTDTVGPAFQLARAPGSSGTAVLDGAGTELRLEQTGTPNFEADEFSTFMGIGRNGSADMTVRNGAAVSMTGEGAFLGVARVEADAFGAGQDPASVEASSLRIESGGQFTLNTPRLEGGASLATTAPSQASMTVTGEGSEFATTTQTGSHFLTVGAQGTADLTVAAGGQVATLFVNIGFSSGSTGTATVQGDGSLLSLSGSGGPDGRADDIGQGAFLTVGRDGQGTLEVLDGGRVTITSDSGTYPGMNIGGGSGDAAGTGTVTVQGTGSEILIDGGADGAGGGRGFLSVGRSNEGTLDIQAGGTVENDPLGTTFVGSDPGTIGTVSLSGAGSALNAGDQLLIGVDFDFTADEPQLDSGGTGTVTVGNGATLRAGEASGDGITDIFVGSGDRLVVEDGATLVGDVRVVGGTFDLRSGATHEGDIL